MRSVLRLRSNGPSATATTSGFACTFRYKTSTTTTTTSSSTVRSAHSEAADTRSHNTPLHVGSLLSQNHLALHLQSRKTSWHRATRHTSAAVHANLGQLENKRWVLWFVRRVRDDRQMAQRMDYGFLVSQLEGFVKQIESVRDVNRQRLIGRQQQDNNTALSGDQDVQNLFYLELSRLLPLMEDCLEGARLPHLVRFVTLFPRLSIATVPTVRHAARHVHDHSSLDITDTSPTGQKLRIAALVENTIAEIEDRVEAVMPSYHNLHRRERESLDQQMLSLHEAVAYFGSKWRDDVFLLTEEERKNIVSAAADTATAASVQEGNENHTSSTIHNDSGCRFPFLEEVFATVDAYRHAQLTAAAAKLSGEEQTQEKIDR